jgi:thiamine biosynthesis lipoprotein
VRLNHGIDQDGDPAGCFDYHDDATCPVFTVNGREIILLRTWRAALEDPEIPGRLWGEVDLVDHALASSGDGGFVFDPAGRFTHLLDPRSGHSPRLHRTVSVVAPDATLADSLSTAFSLMPEGAIAATLRPLPGVTAHVLRHDGSSTLLQGPA